MTKCLAYLDNLRSVIMRVPDMPLNKRGIKDKRLHTKCCDQYMPLHPDMAVGAVESIKQHWSDVEQRLISEWSRVASTPNPAGEDKLVAPAEKPRGQPAVQTPQG